MEGIKNNVFHEVVCECVLKFSRKICLNFSDKAMRPTNLMGASKNFELVVQLLKKMFVTIIQFH